MYILCTISKILEGLEPWTFAAFILSRTSRPSQSKHGQWKYVGFYYEKLMSLGVPGQIHQWRRRCCFLFNPLKKEIRGWAGEFSEFSTDLGWYLSPYGLVEGCWEFFWVSASWETCCCWIFWFPAEREILCFPTPKVPPPLPETEEYLLLNAIRERKWWEMYKRCG